MKYFRTGEAEALPGDAQARREREDRDAARARMERALRAALQLESGETVLIREVRCRQAVCGGVETFIRITRSCGEARSLCLPGSIASQGIAGTGHAIFALAGHHGADNPFSAARAAHSGAQTNATAGEPG
ncbi:MAG: hypothetical protein FJX29_06400 [Alphaproteobacteria bacterium]|nr:hypothetical protein [Alphaproteobacteria bacterium]